VLGGDRKGRAAVRAKEEEEGVGESVQREVGPVLGGGPHLSPGEGQAGTRVPSAETSVIGDVTVNRRSLKRGREPGSGRVDLRGGAHHPQAGQAAFVGEEEFKWGEAGFHSQDVGRGARKAVSGPSLDLVPEGREFSCHVDSGHEGVRAIAENREQK